MEQDEIQATCIWVAVISAVMGIAIGFAFSWSWNLNPAKMLHEWQTLATGLIAIGAAGVAYRAVMRTVRQNDEHHARTFNAPRIAEFAAALDDVRSDHGSIRIWWLMNARDLKRNTFFAKREWFPEMVKKPSKDAGTENWPIAAKRVISTLEIINQVLRLMAMSARDEKEVSDEKDEEFRRYLIQFRCAQEFASQYLRTLQRTAVINPPAEPVADNWVPSISSEFGISEAEIRKMFAEQFEEFTKE